MSVERARVLLDLQRPGQARRLLQQTLAQDPLDPAALCLLAQAHLAEGDPGAAVGVAQAAARVDPGSEWPLRLAALALSRIGQLDAARAYANQAVALDPLNWRTHAARAQVDLAAGQADGVTLAAARHAVYLAPHEPNALRTLGSTQLALRLHDEAGHTLQAAARLAPQDAAIRNELARLDIRRRDLGRAAAGFADAANLDPTDSVAIGNLAVVGARALRVLHLILWVTLLVALHLESSGSRPDRAVLAGSWVVALLAVAGFAGYLWRGSRPRTMVLVRAIARRDRLLDAWAGCLLVCFVGFGVAAAVPPPSASIALSVCFVALFAGVAVSWVRVARLRRRGAASTASRR